MLTNEQFQQIQDAISDLDVPLDKDTVKVINKVIRSLVDKEPYRLEIIDLLVKAEDLALEVIPDDETGELVIWTGTVFPKGEGTYSEIAFMSEVEDDDEEESEEETEE